MKVEATIVLGGGSGWALDEVGLDGAFVESVVADDTMGIEAGETGGGGGGGAFVESAVADDTVGNEAGERGGGDSRMVGGREERHVEAGCSVPGEEDGAGVACCWAGGCFVFEQCPILARGKVVRLLRAFTRE